MKLLTPKQLAAVKNVNSIYEEEFEVPLEYDYTKGYFWQIYEDGLLCMTPKDFYEKENCLADFDYYALDFMNDSDIKECGLEVETSSNYTYQCSEDKLRETFQKYGGFFEENKYMCD